jgi:hypothetical protein
MPPINIADKSRRADLQKEKEAVSVIVFRDVSHSVRRVKLLHHCQKFRGHPILLSSLYVIQSHVSPDGFTHFMEILGGAQLHFAPETSDDLLLLAREVGHNSVIMRLVPQQDFPSF